jgi:hypothetical protein
VVCYVPDEVCILLSQDQQPLLLRWVCCPALTELLQHMLLPLLVSCN